MSAEPVVLHERGGSACEHCVFLLEEIYYLCRWQRLSVSAVLSAGCVFLLGNLRRGTVSCPPMAASWCCCAWFTCMVAGGEQLCAAQQ